MVRVEVLVAVRDPWWTDTEHNFLCERLTFSVR